MLTQKAKYALRAMLMLAESEATGKLVSAIDIAGRERISQKFLEAILLDLRRAGLIESRRGRYGGHFLAKPAAETSFAEIIRAIDGPLAPLRCASRLYFEPCADCVDIGSCAIRWAMVKARDAIVEALDGCSLADALHRENLQLVG